jgi:hypothetical protein
MATSNNAKAADFSTIALFICFILSYCEREAPPAYNRETSCPLSFCLFVCLSGLLAFTGVLQQQEAKVTKYMRFIWYYPEATPQLLQSISGL